VPVIARNFRERLVAPTAIDDIAIKHRDPMSDPSPLADQYGSGIYPGLRDPTRSGASRFIADSVKDPLRGWLEAAQGFLLQTVRNGSNQKRPAHAVWRIDTAKRRPFLSQFAGLKAEKVGDFLFQTFRTATDGGRSLVSVGHTAGCHCRPQLLCGLCLSVGSGSSRAGFFGSIAFLEAGAAARVASLLERRRKIIAAAVSANQVSASGLCAR
jgi:hypothetical protein